MSPVRLPGVGVDRGQLRLEIPLYDLIGDVHGCAHTLHALLGTLGYVHDGECYRHATRQVVFLGDVIDRGPFQRDTVRTAMAMVQGEAALAVMGNHEFNALAYHTPDPQQPSTFLHPHTTKNRQQHRAFVDAYEDDATELAGALRWFRCLPLWLELKTPQGALRVVHACRDPGSMKALQPLLDAGNRITETVLQNASRKGTAEYVAVETLLKGKEVRLPEGQHFLDKDGHERHEVRIKWWKESGTFQSLAMGPETGIPDDPIGLEHLITYAHDAAPVFLGHYWLKGEPELLAPNVACLDYSVAIPNGQLVAYRWDGEQVLDMRHFVTRKRLEAAAP